MGLVEQGERIAAVRLREAIERLAVAARESVPADVVVERSEDGITLEGRRLKVRAMNDPRLRVGEWLR